MSIFSSISQPHYPNAALGIDHDMMTAVALDGNRRQYSIRQAASIEVPDGLVAPSFLDVNIADKPAFATCLMEVVETAGMLNQKRWSVALPSNTARSAIISLETEPANRQEADEVIDWKAEQSFGAPAMELRIARKKISPDREGRSRYFVTAVKLAVIDEYETQFEGLGWTAGLILPRAVSEANWLIEPNGESDSLLISGNIDGFTALLIRGGEPAVVRSVTCTPAEVDDEIYRLVMFYNDRFGGEQGGGLLDRLLVVGRSVLPAKVQEIASEALGRRVNVLSNDEVGLNLPGGGFSFDDLAAPAGLAALGA